MCRNHRITFSCSHTTDSITLCSDSLLPLVKRASVFPYATQVPLPGPPSFKTQTPIGQAKKGRGHDIILTGEEKPEACHGCSEDGYRALCKEVLEANDVHFLLSFTPRDCARYVQDMAPMSKKNVVEVVKSEGRDGVTVKVDPAVIDVLLRLMGANPVAPSHKSSTLAKESGYASIRKVQDMRINNTSIPYIGGLGMLVMAKGSSKSFAHPNDFNTFTDPIIKDKDRNTLSKL